MPPGKNDYICKNLQVFESITKVNLLQVVDIGFIVSLSFTVQPATCFYQSRRAAFPHYKFAPRLRLFSVGKSRGRRGFSVERSGAKRARRGAARLMSLAHDMIGSEAREAALIGVKKINAYRTQKLQTAMSLHNSTTGTDCMCICIQL